jgi:NitT/TauT family transport system permease protein
LAPLFILWFGIGLPAKVMMSFSMVVFIFVLNIVEGVRALDRDPIDLMRTMRASQFYIVRRVLLPAVLPWILASFRIGVGLSLIGALVGELIGSSRGLGWYIERAAGQLDTTGVFTGIVVLVVLAMLANQIIALVSGWLTGARV